MLRHRRVHVHVVHLRVLCRWLRPCQCDVGLLRQHPVVAPVLIVNEASGGPKPPDAMSVQRALGQSSAAEVDDRSLAGYAFSRFPSNQAIWPTTAVRNTLRWLASSTFTCSMLVFPKLPRCHVSTMVQTALEYPSSWSP